MKTVFSGELNGNPFIISPSRYQREKKMIPASTRDILVTLVKGRVKIMKTTMPATPSSSPYCLPIAIPLKNSGLTWKADENRKTTRVSWRVVFMDSLIMGVKQILQNRTIFWITNRSIKDHYLLPGYPCFSFFMVVPASRYYSLNFKIIRASLKMFSKNYKWIIVCNIYS